MDPALLPLRDVHLPAAPTWWPPAPGWWLLAAGLGLVLALLLVALLAFLAWRGTRRRRWLRWFDEATAAAAAPQRIAQMSMLLRRAARRCSPGAELLQGEAWLHFLDGRSGSAFSDGPGRLLLEGAFQPRLPDDVAGVAAALARQRFVELMEGRR